MVDLIQRAGIVLAHGRPPARALGLPLCPSRLPEQPNFVRLGSRGGLPTERRR